MSKTLMTALLLAGALAAFADTGRVAARCRAEGPAVPFPDPPPQDVAEK